EMSVNNTGEIVIMRTSVQLPCQLRAPYPWFRYRGGTVYGLAAEYHPYEPGQQQHLVDLPRVGKEPPHPLQAQHLHKARRAANSAGEHIERSANADQHGAAQGGAMRADPL